MHNGNVVAVVVVVVRRGLGGRGIIVEVIVAAKINAC